jgi:hypothetical protein
VTISPGFKAALCVAVVATLGVRGVQAQGNNAAAQAAAETWVALIDQAQYAASWQAAASCQPQRLIRRLHVATGSTRTLYESHAWSGIRCTRWRGLPPVTAPRPPASDRENNGPCCPVPLF